MSAERIRELTHILNEASRAYYQEDREIMSNREYDALYDELVSLENQTGIRLSGSPAQKVGYEVAGALVKVPHDSLMLSLDKTKSPDALREFLGGHEGLLSLKLDGLTIILKYENGLLKQAVTRGNGQIGEDVTHNARVFLNVPLRVPYRGRFSLRGEAVISQEDFLRINDEISEPDQKYKNPRNLCSGTVRQLNSEMAAKRRVRFYAFGLTHAPGLETSAAKKSLQLEWLQSQGFTVVEYAKVDAASVENIVEEYRKKISGGSMPLASDGLVLTYDDITYSESLGATAKFPRDSIAFKWADELAKTTLLRIEWNTSRTGLINPVAVFDPVDIEGSTVNRASLHNVSVLRELELGEGDTITVYKANMIIPQVAENLTRSATAVIPAHCPACKGAAEILRLREGEALYCTHPRCSARLVSGLVHFTGRDAINIEGFSEQTIEKFIAMGFIKDYSDLFRLAEYENEILEMEGFGRKSFDNLMNAVEKALDVPLPNFIYALGIPHVGLANAKLLCVHFMYDLEKIIQTCGNENYLEELSLIKGFGEAISFSLHQYFSDAGNMDILNKTIAFLRLQKPEINSETGRPLAGLTFVITGEVYRFENRKALQAFIEKHGGRAAGSVTAKTSYLINNDAGSSSSKNKKAAELGVPVITEDGFFNLGIVEI